MSGQKQKVRYQEIIKLFMITSNFKGDKPLRLILGRPILGSKMEILCNSSSNVWALCKKRPSYIQLQLPAFHDVHMGILLALRICLSAAAMLILELMSGLVTLKTP